MDADKANSCPYRVFSTNFLNIPFDNLFSNANGDLVFKTKNFLKDCDFEMFETTEVFFLINNQTNFLHLKKDERAIDDLLMSESDGLN